MEVLSSDGRYVPSLTRRASLFAEVFLEKFLERVLIMLLASVGGEGRNVALIYSLIYF
jgi:hypothetical protein